QKIIGTFSQLCKIKYKEASLILNNSKLAIHSIDEIASKRKDLEHSWKFFMTENTIPNTIRSAVQASWIRCKAYCVDPLQQHSLNSLYEDDLKKLINTSNFYH